MSAPEYQQPPSTAPAARQRRITFRQVIGILLLIAMLVFIFENTAQVNVRLFYPKVKVALFVALLIAAALGGLGTLLLQHRRHRR